jgi:hypothetical protein
MIGFNAAISNVHSKMCTIYSALSFGVLSRSVGKSITTAGVNVLLFVFFQQCVQINHGWCLLFFRLTTSVFGCIIFSVFGCGVTQKKQFSVGP